MYEKRMALRPCGPAPTSPVELPRIGRAMRGLMKSALACAMVLCGAAWITGCGDAAAPPPPPMPEVTIVQPLQREVIQWDEYTGTLQATDTVNLAARVSGFVEKADFKEGTIVHKGDLLVAIDPRPFRADLDAKVAATAQAQSQADQAKVHFDRYAKVRGTQAISEDDYDVAKAAYDQAKAAVEAAKAAEENSRLNLEWTQVIAPITGRISRKYVTAGNLVNGGAGQATQLTSIVSLDPIYCYVDIPGRAFLKYHDLSELEKQTNLRNGAIPCFVGLENEKNFPHEGVIDFMDNQIDPTTGTMQIRGVLPNPGGGVLTPGLFARLRIPGSARYTTLLVPDAAVGTDQAENFLLLVGSDGVVERRRIELGALFGTLRSITGGLKPGEAVIVNGMMQAAPGRQVKPHDEPIAADALDITGAGSPSTRALPTSEPATQPAP